MYSLAFLDPGYFHAALTLRERQPRANDEMLGEECAYLDVDRRGAVGDRLLRCGTPMANSGAGRLLAAFARSTHDGVVSSGNI